MKKNFISVIIPTRTLNDYILKENLPAFVKQTYKSFEVIILPNNSDPRDKKLLNQYPWLRIIPTGKVTRPAQKRDIGAKYSKGDILAFIDDDAYASPEWLEQAVAVFDGERLTKEKRMLTAVCGPGMLPENAGYWEIVFDAVLKTWIGSGGYSYRFNPEKQRFVDDYPSMNFLVKKSVFDKIGGFNSEYWPGEDSKLCEDIVYKENGSIMYSPEVVVYHHKRNNLISYLKQHGGYGFHRGAFFAHGDKNSRRLSYLTPSFFVLYLLMLFSRLIWMQFRLEQFSIISALPIILYCLFLVYLLIKTFISMQSITVAAGAVLVLFLTHIVYGILFIKGFFTGIIRKENIYS